MDRIALVSDIHGNIPALEAVFADINGRGVDRIFCLGDLVGKGPESDVAVDICRGRCEKTVIGNWDAILANEDSPSSLPENVQTRNWYRRQLGSERLLYLKNLPGTIEFPMSGRNVRLFHASQQSVYYRVLHSDPLQKHLAMFDNTPFTGYSMMPDVVGYADIHFAYEKTYGDKLLFNVGSVGNPLDKPLACYGMLEGEYGSRNIAPFSLQIIRLPYDIDLAVSRAHVSGMPEVVPYETELRTARYRGLPANRSAK